MVSKRLARLEARLGANLIHRTTRRLAPTQAGAHFYNDVVAILDAASAAEARVAGQSGKPGGPLRLSAPTSFGRMHVAPHLKDFLDRFPTVELEINLSDEFIDLIATKTDLAIRIAPDVGAGVTAERLATSRRILCAAPAYLLAHGRPMSIEQLGQHRLLAAGGQLPWRLSGPDDRSITVEGVSHVRTNSSEVVRELAIAGIGIALRSLWDISGDLAEGRLVQLLPQYEGSSSVGIYAVSPGMQKRSPGAAALTDYLKQLYAPRPPWEV
jgi:DNA-binding transcriptional LysR family regulator